MRCHRCRTPGAKSPRTKAPSAKVPSPKAPAAKAPRRAGKAAKRPTPAAAGTRIGDCGKRTLRLHPLHPTHPPTSYYTPCQASAVYRESRPSAARAHFRSRGARCGHGPVHQALRVRFQ
eukprot:scaffold6407_cov62-Phaeocystis_antarctica.AAC.4